MTTKVAVSQYTDFTSNLGGSDQEGWIFIVTISSQYMGKKLPRLEHVFPYKNCK